jgi:hypothetical protein
MERSISCFDTNKLTAFPMRNPDLPEIRFASLNSVPEVPRIVDFPLSASEAGAPYSGTNVSS